MMLHNTPQTNLTNNKATPGYHVQRFFRNPKKITPQAMRFSKMPFQKQEKKKEITNAGVCFCVHARRFQGTALVISNEKPYSFIIPPFRFPSASLKLSEASSPSSQCSRSQRSRSSSPFRRSKCPLSEQTCSPDCRRCAWRSCDRAA